MKLFRVFGEYEKTGVKKKIPLQEMYKQYVEHCRNKHMIAVTEKAFAKELRKLGFRVERGTDNKTCVHVIQKPKR